MLLFVPRHALLPCPVLAAVVLANSAVARGDLERSPGLPLLSLTWQQRGHAVLPYG